MSGPSSRLTAAWRQCRTGRTVAARWQFCFRHPYPSPHRRSRNSHHPRARLVSPTEGGRCEAIEGRGIVAIGAAGTGVLAQASAGASGYVDPCQEPLLLGRDPANPNDFVNTINNEHRPMKPDAVNPCAKATPRDMSLV